MAKKDFNNVVSGLLSYEEEELLNEQEGAQAQSLSPVVKETPKRGRPKQETTQLSEGSGNVRTSLILKESVYNKLKQIAKKEGFTNTELLSIAMELLVERYEKKHGKLPKEGQERNIKDIF